MTMAISMVALWLFGCAENKNKGDVNRDSPIDVPDTAEVNDTSDTDTGEGPAQTCDGYVYPENADSGSQTCISIYDAPAGWLPAIGTSYVNVNAVDLDVSISRPEGDGQKEVMLFGWDQNYQLLRCSADGCVDEASTAGLNFFGGSAGYTNGIWGDCDSDGDLDLVLAGLYGADSYRNDAGVFTPGSGEGALALSDSITYGAGSFVVSGGNTYLWLGTDNGLKTYEVSDCDFTEQGLDTVANPGTATEITKADYDHDGDDDVFVAVAAGGGNQLYDNKNNGTFEPVEAGAGLANDTENTLDAIWFDPDGDGEFPDLMTASYNDTSSWYQNNKDGTFANISSSNDSPSNCQTIEISYQALPDTRRAIYYSCYGEEDSFRVEDNEGIFKNVLPYLNVTPLTNTMGSVLADINADGIEDVVTVSWDEGVRAYINESSGY